MKLEFSRQLEKYSNTKFHENPCIGSPVVPYGQKDGRKSVWADGQTDMTKLIIAFRNFGNAPTNSLQRFVTYCFKHLLTKSIIIIHLKFDRRDHKCT